MFHVPCTLWFSPIVQQLIQFPAPAMSSAARRRSASGIPVICATRAGGWSATTPAMPSQPRVLDRTNSSSTAPASTSRCSNPFSRARSVPGRTGRCRSAASAVGVRRGSTTTSLAPARTRSIIRRNRIGWQSAMLEPMTRNTSAWSKSS